MQTEIESTRRKVENKKKFARNGIFSSFTSGILTKILIRMKLSKKKHLSLQVEQKKSISELEEHRIRSCYPR